MKNKKVMGVLFALLALSSLQYISNNMYVYNVENICNRNIQSHEESGDSSGVCVYDEKLNMYRIEF